MELPRELPVALLDLIRRRVAIHAEDCVIVFVFHRGIPPRSRMEIIPQPSREPHCPRLSADRRYYALIPDSRSHSCRCSLPVSRSGCIGARGATLRRPPRMNFSITPTITIMILLAIRNSYFHHSRRRENTSMKAQGPVGRTPGPRGSSGPALCLRSISRPGGRLRTRGSALP